MPGTLDRMLRAQVASRPDEAAVVFGGDHLTFRELHEGAAVLAAYLRTLGVVANQRVGICLEPALELAIGTWGVVLSGGAYVPLSPERSGERLRRVIEDSGAQVVVTQEVFRARVDELAPPGTTVVTFKDAVQYAWRTAGAEWPLADVVSDASQLAYVVYPSAFGDRVVGLATEHRSIVAQLGWVSAEHELGPGATVVQKLPMDFEAGRWEILAPGVGARVVFEPAYPWSGMGEWDDDHSFAAGDHPFPEGVRVRPRLLSKAGEVAEVAERVPSGLGR
ncbi:AMP-binding protein [Streptomyces sp. NPDC048717]|uniref:AMP-binding protein n=1 Tax=Streptomyces sp. NPDC048717 TaxID=3154928 RepID=UPI00342064F7